MRVWFVIPARLWEGGEGGNLGVGNAERCHRSRLVDVDGHLPLGERRIWLETGIRREKMFAKRRERADAERLGEMARLSFLSLFLGGAMHLRAVVPPP